MKILELPFRERPVLELLDLAEPPRLLEPPDRTAPNRDYTGYGWARVPRIWLDETPIDDALVLAMHSADDGEVLPDDIELEFELPGEPVTVLASTFLAKWLPTLPRASAVVLAMCNPHHARLAATGGAPLYYATGDVVAWLDPGDRIRLAADGSWARLDP